MGWWSHPIREAHVHPSLCADDLLFLGANQEKQKNPFSN
jgi:hypothetical protein